MSAPQRAEQANSDPLPFVQVDRSAHQLAAALGTRLGLPYQHVLGGLVVFWGINGKPRELEALIRAGKSEVVLSATELTRRFNVAMGQDLDPTALEALELLGLVEPRAEGYRVRGMARFFKPLEKRAKRQAAASAAGKASARLRAAKYGSADPRSSARSPGVHETFSDRSRDRSADEAAGPRRRARGERVGERPPNTEDRDQISDLVLQLPVPVAPPRDRDRAQEVFDHWRQVMHSPRSVFDKKRRAAVEARLREGRSVEDLKKAIDGCAKNSWHMGQNDRGRAYNDLELICRDAGHLEGFMANADTPPAPRAPRGVVAATAGSGPIVAREVVL